MNQDEGAGHSEITRLAVHQMFEDERRRTGNQDVLVHGLTEEQYAQQLDQSQEHQDRVFDASDLAHQIQHGAPLGPTVRPSSWDPDVQRQHAMSDPSMSGDQNLQVDRQYIVDQLDSAHAAQSAGQDDMADLGAAVHATEDSYSEAHMWRGDAVHSGDPTAPIESINNFDWTHLTAAGSGDNAVLLEGTHDARFDYAPVTTDADGNPQEVLGTDRAAVAATTDILERYEASRGQDAQTADASMQAAVDPYFQAADGGVTVNRTADASFLAEDQRRWDIQQQQMQDAGIDHLDFSGMDNVLHYGGEVVNAVEGAVQTVENTVSSAATAVADTATAVYDDVSSAVSSAASTVADTATAVYDDVSSAVSSAASTVADTATAVYDDVSSAVSSVASTVADTASTVASDVADAASSAVNAVEDAASSAVDTVESWFE